MALGGGGALLTTEVDPCFLEVRGDRRFGDLSLAAMCFLGMLFLQDTLTVFVYGGYASVKGGMVTLMV